MAFTTTDCTVYMLNSDTAERIAILHKGTCDEGGLHAPFALDAVVDALVPDGDGHGITLAFEFAREDWPTQIEVWTRTGRGWRISDPDTSKPAYADYI